MKKKTRDTGWAATPVDVGDGFAALYDARNTAEHAAARLAKCSTPAIDIELSRAMDTSSVHQDVWCELPWFAWKAWLHGGVSAEEHGIAAYMIPNIGATLLAGSDATLAVWLGVTEREIKRSMSLLAVVRVDGEPVITRHPGIIALLSPRWSPYWTLGDMP